MNRALIWKEWRQQRPLVITAVAASLMLPLFALIGSLGGVDVDALTMVVPALQILVILPAFALATGALSFAEDRSERAYGFLMSRPASHRRVWLIKVAVALGAFLLIVAASGGVAAAVAAMADGPVETDYYTPYENRIGGWGPRGFAAAALPGGLAPSGARMFLAIVIANPLFLMLLFGSAVVWSTRLSRPFHAMLAGGATALAIMSVQLPLFLATAQDSVYRFNPYSPLYIAAILLAVSFATFRATDPATL